MQKGQKVAGAGAEVGELRQAEGSMAKVRVLEEQMRLLKEEKVGLFTNCLDHDYPIILIHTPDPPGTGAGGAE